MKTPPLPCDVERTTNLRSLEQAQPYFVIFEASLEVAVQASSPEAARAQMQRPSWQTSPRAPAVSISDNSCQCDSLDIGELLVAERSDVHARGKTWLRSQLIFIWLTLLAWRFWATQTDEGIEDAQSLARMNGEWCPLENPPLLAWWSRLRGLLSEDLHPTQLMPGARGYVKKVDVDGDILWYIPGLARTSLTTRCVISMQDFTRLTRFKS